VELINLDLSDNSLCSARGSASIDASGLKELLSVFTHAPRTSTRRSALGGVRSPRTPQKGSGFLEPGGSGSPHASPKPHAGRQRAHAMLLSPAAKEGSPGGKHPQPLSGRASLQALDLSRNQLCSAGAVALAAVLKSSRTLGCAQGGLRTLRLAGCLLGEAGALTLAPALAKCLALTHLDLNSNFLYDAGAVAIASWLGSSAPKLQQLALACNGIGDKGALRARSPLDPRATCAGTRGEAEGNQL
jgi:hypothetical protein